MSAADARIEWLQDQLTLHNGVELMYVVDGYTVDLMEHDGATCWLSVHGETLADAIDGAMERQRAIRPVHGEAKP